MKIDPVRPTHFQLQQHGFQTFACTAKVGVSIKDIVEGNGYFGHVGRQLRYSDEIRVMAEDGSYVARLIVILADGANIKTQLLSVTDLATSLEADSEPEYFTQLCGMKKYCIKRRSDGVTIKEGIDSKLGAEKELADYITAQGR